jgi:ABC-type lipoprotein export system ATPase subunit
MATTVSVPVTDATKDTYVMIDSIKIKNLRGFRDLDISGLKRVNVIAGDSGSGKTAFLESIFLTGGSNPEIYMRMRQWRGLSEGPLRVTGTRRGYESLFRELFFEFDQTQAASVEFKDSERGPRSLTIKYRSDAEYTLPLKGRGELSPLSMIPLQFKWKIADRTHEGVVQIVDGNLSFRGFQEVYPVWLISPVAGDPVAEHFSELSKRKQHLPIVEAMRGVFPAISALSLESIAGQIVVCASLDYLSEKLPVGMISGGIAKYLWILTAIASNPGGVVLIDELESGLYFKAMPVILASIVKFARENRVQIFVTTHSAELLEAFADVMEADPEHFSFLKAERTEKECTIRIARGPSSIAAIHQHIELR